MDERHDLGIFSRLLNTLVYILGGFGLGATIPYGHQSFFEVGGEALFST